jgi:hypothetical protein
VSRLYLVAGFDVPPTLHGAELGFAIRPLSVAEVVAIEDQFHIQGDERRIPPGSIAYILTDAPAGSSDTLDLVTMVEFACSIVVVTGHPSFLAVGTFAHSACTHVRLIPRSISDSQHVSFVSTLTASGMLQWLRRCLQAQANSKDRLHITANRFVRFAKSENFADAIMDLCISLESLLDHQTEVSFRFSICLTRIIEARGEQGETAATLLSELYDVRSKIAHGNPSASKLLRKLEPRLPQLNALAKEILTRYILFLSDHTRTEWKAQINKSLYT